MAGKINLTQALQDIAEAALALEVIRATKDTVAEDDHEALGELRQREEQLKLEIYDTVMAVDWRGLGFGLVGRLKEMAGGFNHGNEQTRSGTGGRPGGGL